MYVNVIHVCMYVCNGMYGYVCMYVMYILMYVFMFNVL